MEDTSGFYLNEQGGLVFGPNFVENKNFTLNRHLKDTYEYPVHGWYWFDSEEQAREFFGMPPKPPEPSFDHMNTYNTIGDYNAGNI